jgi:hypothetical protein
MAPSFYLQHVEGLRPDVTVIEIGMLTFPWFHDYLYETDKALVARSKSEFERHRQLIDQEEGGTRPLGDSRARLAQGTGFVRSLIRDNYAFRPVLVTGDLEPEKQGAIFNGMTYRFFPDSARPTPYDGPVPAPQT